MIHRISLLSLLALLSLAGCGGGDKPKDANKPNTNGVSSTDGKPATDGKTPVKSKGTIGLSVLKMDNPFFVEIADAMKDEAAKHGYEVVVVSADDDAGKQMNQVNDFIVRKVAAIVLTPRDARAIGSAIKDANKAGIPVFTADTGAIGEGFEVVSHIATDNYAGGRQAAIALVEAIGGKGKVAILDHPDLESVMLRTKGFKDELAELNKKEGVNVEIVATLPGGGASDKSLSATRDVMQAHADLAGIFAINDPSALGAIAALEPAGKLGSVKIVGFDGMPEGKKAIRDGKIYADPIQFPDQIGRKTVQAIVAHFNGEKVEKQTLIPTALYRKKDAEADKSIK